MDVMSPTQPRVLMVVRLFHPWVGGTERQALKVAKALRQAGAEVTILTGRWFRGTSGREVIDGVPVVRHHTLWEFFGIRGLRRLGGYLYMLTLARQLWLLRGTYDVIHVHGLNYHAAVASVVGRRLRKPTVVKIANSGDASDVERMRRGQQLPGSGVFLRAALGCDRLVALTPVIAKELEEAGVEPERIVSIPNGVEMPPGAPSASDPDRVGVVFVGRLHRQKGVDLLVEAAARLAPRMEGDLLIRLVGDGPERPALDTLVRSRGLGDVVIFAGTLADPEAELDRAQICALPSRTEGMSNTLLEAMARGCPVVATAVPGNSAVVADGRTGVLIPPEDPIALADAIERLAADPGLRTRLGRQAQREAACRYSIEGVAARYRQLYEELLDHRTQDAAIGATGVADG